MEAGEGRVSTVPAVVEGTQPLKTWSPRGGMVLVRSSAVADSITTLLQPCPYWFQLDLSD